MSAWKKPSRKTWVKKIVTPSRASLGMSTPASRSRCTWLIGTPSMRSMTITSWVQSSHTISGTSTRPRLCMLRRSCAALAASRTRSSSSCRYLSNSATTWRGFSRLPSADQRSTTRATWRMTSTSSSIAASMPGRSTLTATSRPSFRTAKCTCAIDALATGAGVEAGEDRAERLAERLLDDRARDVVGKRRHAVLQARRARRRCRSAAGRAASTAPGRT